MIRLPDCKSDVVKQIERRRLERYQHFPPIDRLEEARSGYLRRLFLVRTLSLTDGRLLVLVMGELLRRRRRSHRASAEKKWVATQ